MAEREEIFNSKIKYTGIFDFKSFYKFCHEWLTEELGLNLSEDKYTEKLAGNEKTIEITWSTFKKVTDYFRFNIKLKYKITGLQEVEITEAGKKIKTNKGVIELKVKGELVRDYEGKFERTAFNKFLRSIYEKWVIKSRIDQYEDKLITDCDEFLSQAKAFLDLEGKK